MVQGLGKLRALEQQLGGQGGLTGAHLCMSCGPKGVCLAGQGRCVGVLLTPGCRHALRLQVPAVSWPGGGQGSWRRLHLADALTKALKDAVTTEGPCQVESLMGSTPVLVGYTWVRIGPGSPGAHGAFLCRLEQAQVGGPQCGSRREKKPHFLGGCCSCALLVFTPSCTPTPLTPELPGSLL